MPRKFIRIVLPEVDRVRWQGAADLAGVELERFVRQAVEAEIERRAPTAGAAPRSGRVDFDRDLLVLTRCPLRSVRR